MKKITAIIMVMAIAITTAFAVTNPANNTLTLNYDVKDKVTLAYGFKMDGDSTEKTTFDFGPSDGKIAGATKTFSIIDHSYYNASTAYSLKITIGDPTIWTNTEFTTETGSDPESSDLSKGTEAEDVSLTVSGKSVTVAYPAVTTNAGIINRVSATDGKVIATFTITWVDAEVAAGTYQSTTNITYETV